MQPAGDWLEVGRIWERHDGEIGFTVDYLDQPTYAEFVSPQTWYYWTDHPCPHLDPTINGGRIHAWKVKDPRQGEIGQCWVFLRRDVKTVAARLRGIQQQGREAKPTA